MKAAPCVSHKNGMIVVCHVDDILIFANTSNEIRKFKIMLKKNFVVKELGDPAQFSWI